MFEKTNGSFGVNEVLLASVFAAVVFSLAAAQPLVIVGVTGMDADTTLKSVVLTAQVLSPCSTTRYTTS
jgi:hypothetical protein